MFQLHYHGNLSIIEQCYLTAEDRTWWKKRLQKQFEKEKNSQGHTASTPSMPHIPRPNISVPSISGIRK